MKREKNIPPNRRILTIPNLLTLFRLILIPVIAWLYCARQDYAMAAAMLVLSGVTDVADGYIARHFNMISDLGKMLDPVADKLTQFMMLLCLFSRFPAMLLPSILMVIKECIAAVTGLCVIHKTGNVYGSVWHGKLPPVCCI